jgi:Na+/H+-dicarboxylate symporter
MSTTLIAVVIGIVLVTTIKPGKKYNTSNVLFFGKTEN